MTDQKIKLIIEAINQTDAAFNGLKRHLKDSQVDTDTLNAKSRNLTGSIMGLAASFVSVAAALKAIQAAASAGITYLAKIETSALGIAAAFMTGGKYIDATSGKALAAQDALTAAQGDSKKIIEDLQYANLQTIATLDELINAYQVTLPVALAKGFNRQQVKDFTVAMVQAAGAIGLQMNQLSEETRSLLTGAIDPRTSRIATVLGLRNEDINKFKGDANGLFNFLMDKLAAYRAAGDESQKTWAGLWSNFKDIINQSLGKAFEPLFAALKEELKSIADYIVTIDDKSKKIKWNPEFLDGINAFRDGVRNVIAEVYRLGMLLDKIGGSFTGIMHELSFEQLRGGDRWAKANDEYRKRYMRSEKALMDMALRSDGWKPVTPEFNKKLLTASPQEKKKYQYFQTEVGEEDQFTKQQLRYYRENGQKKDAKWEGNTPKPDEDKDAKKARKAAEVEAAEFDALRNYDKEGSQHEKMTAMMMDSSAMFNKMEMEHRQSEMDELTKSSEYKQTVLQAEHTNALSLNNELAEEEIANSENRLNSYRTMYDGMKGERGRYYQYMLESLEEQRKIHEQHTGNKIAADKWYTEQKKKLDEELILSGDNLFGGMKLGWESWLKEAGESGRAGFDLIKKAINGAADALADFVMTGKADFKSLTNSIVRDLIRIEIQKAITWVAGGGKSDTSGKSGLVGTAVSLIGNWLLSANGNVFDGGHLVKYALGGIVNRPTVFPMANGAGLMGEAGPEAIMPLKRGADGKLGLAGSGGGGIHIGNLTIVGLDTQSFADVCKRNPAAVITPMVEALKSNSSLRYLMQDLLGES
jgi:lambda family phage tail tape measure protein